MFSSTWLDDRFRSVDRFFHNIAWVLLTRSVLVPTPSYTSLMALAAQSKDSRDENWPIQVAERCQAFDPFSSVARVSGLETILHQTDILKEPSIVRQILHVDSEPEASIVDLSSEAAAILPSPRRGWFASLLFYLGGSNDVNAHDFRQNTVGHKLAVLAGNPEHDQEALLASFVALLEAGLDLSILNRDKKNVVHLLAENGSAIILAEIARRAIEHKIPADVLRAQDGTGKVALQTLMLLPQNQGNGVLSAFIEELGKNAEGKALLAEMLSVRVTSPSFHSTGAASQMTMYDQLKARSQQLGQAAAMLLEEIQPEIKSVSPLVPRNNSFLNFFSPCASRTDFRRIESQRRLSTSQESSSQRLGVSHVS